MARHSIENPCAMHTHAHDIPIYVLGRAGYMAVETAAAHHPPWVKPATAHEVSAGVVVFKLRACSP
jgi:hypothetical protein